MTQPQKDRYLPAVEAWLARTCPYAGDRVVVKSRPKPPVLGVKNGRPENPTSLTARIRRIVSDAMPDGISSAGIESALRRLYPDERAGIEKISALAGQECRRGRLRGERHRRTGRTGVMMVWFIVEDGE
jgi:hypothetical protein